MPSIQIEPRNNSGPYAYRVYGKDHPDAGPSGQYWDYLGPAGKVDPENPKNGRPLTDEEIAELREEGFALARFRDNVKLEFGSRRDANHTRDELIDQWGEDVLAPTDDRRENEIELAEGAPEGAEILAAADAQTSRMEHESGPGHAELDRGEARRVRWEDAENGKLHARRVKAGLLDKGISDWEKHYNPDETAEEIINNTDKTANSGGERMDAGEREVPSKLSNDLDREEEWVVKGVTEDGSDEAAEILQNDFGWDTDEVEAIRENPDEAEKLL